MQNLSSRKTTSNQLSESSPTPATSVQPDSVRIGKDSSSNVVRLSHILSGKQSSVTEKPSQLVFPVIKNIQSQYGISEEISQFIQEQESISGVKKSSSKHHIRPLSLQEKILEAHLRVNDQAYQELLIREKELELDLIQEQAAQKKVRNRIAKAKKIIEEAQCNVKKANYDLQKKKDYLNDYYTFLDNKLQGGSGVPQSLFNKLGKLQTILTEKQLVQERNLLEDMEELRNTEQELRKRFQELTLKKQKLCVKFEQQNSERKSSQQIKYEQQKLQKRKELQKRFQEYKKYKHQIQKQTHLNKTLEGEEKILKKLLNIEQEHKKHCLIIENGIKKQFRIRLRDNRYKETVGLEYSFKLPELLTLITNRKSKKQQLKDKIEKKNQQLDDLKMRINFLIVRYSTLQSEILSKKN